MDYKKGHIFGIRMGKSDELWDPSSVLLDDEETPFALMFAASGGRRVHHRALQNSGEL